MATSAPQRRRIAAVVYNPIKVDIDKLKKAINAGAKKAGWEKLLNRAGTTFRKLPDAEKQGLTEARALALMEAQPSMIKRPVLALGDRLIVGFDTAEYASAIASLPRD